MNPEIVAPPAEEMGDPKSPAALEEIHVQERRPIFGLCNIAHLMTPQVGKLRPPFEIELPHKGCACLAFAIYMFIGAVLVLAPGNAKGLLPIISEMCLTYMMPKVASGKRVRMLGVTFLHVDMQNDRFTPQHGGIYPQ